MIDDESNGFCEKSARLRTNVVGIQRWWKLFTPESRFRILVSDTNSGVGVRILGRLSRDMPYVAAKCSRQPKQWYGVVVLVQNKRWRSTLSTAVQVVSKVQPCGTESEHNIDGMGGDGKNWYGNRWGRITERAEMERTGMGLKPMPVHETPNSHAQ